MKTILYAITAAFLLTAAPVCLPAATILGLYSDPGHTYTFTPSGGGAVVSEPVAPYPGHIDTTAYGLICMDFLKHANWNTDYSGAVHAPTTALELQTAYLANLLAQVAPGTPVSQYGMISMAIWQLNDPAAGHVPIDPAAQTYVSRAQSLYSAGLLTAANFPNTLIWVPQDTSVQRFMTAVQGANMPTPEPGTVGLFASGVLLLALGIRRRRV